MAKVGSVTSHQAMAASPAISSSFLPLPAIASLHQTQNHQLYFLHNNPTLRTPPGVRSGWFSRFKLQSFLLEWNCRKKFQNFSPTFLGFTRTAEIWNSRTCMVGLIGIFIVESDSEQGNTSDNWRRSWQGS
nr:light-harvesting complex-like protein OHP1, chloroplastic [Coffea arabica]